MSILSLSCANCSAPLEIDGDTERFTCAYCGSAQILERKGGTVSLKKVESAINAVQRGTDRTAAELAIPRLAREREVVLGERAAALKAHAENHARARSGRFKLTAIIFVAVFFIGGMINGSVTAKPAIQAVISFAWIASLFALPIFVFRKVKLPPNDPKRVASEYDLRLSRIDAHLRANREILDKLPH